MDDSREELSDTERNYQLAESLVFEESRASAAQEEKAGASEDAVPGFQVQNAQGIKEHLFPTKQHLNQPSVAPIKEQASQKDLPSPIEPSESECLKEQAEKETLNIAFDGEKKGSNTKVRPQQLNTDSITEQSINRGGESRQQTKMHQSRQSQEFITGQRCQFQLSSPLSSATGRNSVGCDECRHVQCENAILRERVTELEVRLLKQESSSAGSPSRCRSEILGEYTRRSNEPLPQRAETNELARSQIVEQSSEESAEQAAAESIAINSSKQKRESYGILGSAERDSSESAEPSILNSSAPPQESLKLRVISSVREAPSSCEESVVLNQPKTGEFLVVPRESLSMSVEQPQHCKKCLQLQQTIAELNRKFEEQESGFLKKPLQPLCTTEMIRYEQIASSKPEESKKLQKTNYALRQLLLRSLQFEELLVKILTKCDHYREMFARWSAKIQFNEDLFGYFAAGKKKLRQVDWQLEEATKQFEVTRQQLFAKCKQFASAIYLRFKEPIRPLLELNKQVQVSEDGH